MTEQEYELKVQQIEELRREINKENRQRKLNTIHSHSHFVGKCFIRKKTNALEYYKILSEYSENEYRVECLKFRLPFRANIDKILVMHGSRYPDCSIEAIPFETESIMINSHINHNDSISDWEEITEKEFYEHMDICYNQFVEWSKYKDIIKEENDDLMFRKQKEGTF